MKNNSQEHKTSLTIILIFALFYLGFADNMVLLIPGLSAGEANFLIYLWSLALIAISIIIFSPKINMSIKFKDIILIAFCYLLIRFFDTISHYLYEWLAPKQELPANQASLIKIKENSPFYFYITVIFLGPIAEEWFYRYGFQNFFKKYMSEIQAIILTALIFGFLHIWHGLFSNKNPYELIYLINYSGASISFSYAYYKTKRISVPIILHILNNLIASI